MAQFFGFGHFLNDDTLLSDVRAVPPATIGTFRSADRAYTEAQYWQLRPTRASQSSEALAATLEDRFVAAVATRAKPGERLGLSLSGGLDARTILGVMPEGANLQTISLGIDGSLDHRSASQLASIAAVPHHPFVLGGDFLTDFERHLRQMVRLTDGHYIDQGIVLPVMDLYRQLGIDYLLRGHGGELLHMRKAYAYSLDDAALGASPAELRTWLLSHLSDYMLGGVPDHLFTFDLRGAAEASLDAALERCQAADRPVDKVWQLFLNERIHRETTLSMHTFECFAAVRQPYLDNDVIDALFSMPAEMKLGDALQVGILRHRRPAFLGVTNSNTGTRLGAGRLETALARLRLRVGARLGLKGYQPYERLGLWLRRELRGFVQRTLSGPFVLDQSLIRADVVKRVVEEHLDERANHTFLIMALLIFALGEELRADARRRQGLVESGAGRGAVP
jgi:asparagine synthase (glutamine-hydrolysing)